MKFWNNNNKNLWRLEVRSVITWSSGGLTAKEYKKLSVVLEILHILTSTKATCIHMYICQNSSE